jgi:hypothetical protein
MVRLLANALRHEQQHDQKDRPFAHVSSSSHLDFSAHAERA